MVKSPLIIYERGIYRPEPTRFWLLDKELKKEVSRLEEKGYIAKFSKLISEKEELLKLFIRLHEEEVRERKRILLLDYPEVFYGRGKWDEVCKRVILDESVGIGGIRNFRRKPFKVRCLHLWVAYHLGSEKFKNPIGEWVLKLLSKS